MSGHIDKDMAKKIARKLKARIQKNTPAHDLATVWHEGEMIASFGIRRGSRKNLGHGHIPEELGVNQRFAKELGSCTKSLKDYLATQGLQ